ncbi:MAG TPA: hypothetical protein VE467_05755 [Chryseolinea sp.]|nr:hypothetical protein [Chryseolinea sp.]
MKFHQVLLSAFVFVTACSSPKYVYHFDQYDYNVGKRSGPQKVAVIEENPLLLDEKNLVVSSAAEPIIIAEKQPVPYTTVREVAEKFKTMSKREKKEFRKGLRKELVNYSKKSVLKKNDGVESVNATQKFDTLVTLAIVFGGAGIVLITLANISNAFWIAGVISLVVGAFFFVKWVANGNG